MSAPTPKAQPIQLRVHRGTGDGTTHTTDYTLPGDAAASLLDGLRWVRANIDDTLAFRYACINANACKECMMKFDGKVVYACMAKLQPGHTHEVAPLHNKPRVRDLITEISPSKERLFPGDEGDDD